MPSLQQPISPAERDRIARELGVSPRTVKRAMEGGPNVSPETRASVAAELERLGFGRMPEAVVGLVIPDLQNPFFAELADSLESLLAQHDMQLVIATSNDYGRRENLHIRWMIGMRASGVFYCKNPPFPESLHTLETASNLSVVLIDIEPEDSDMDAVLADSQAGITRAVDHLAIENQHERIGFLAGPVDSNTAAARREAFDNALDEYGLRDVPPIILQGDYTFESGTHAALTLAKRKRQGMEMPTAIVSANDLMAIGLINGLTKIESDIGLRVPDQLSVIGFDKIATSKMITPELTSIDQRVGEIAERAVRMMIRRIDARNDEEMVRTQREYVSPELVPGQSVTRYASPGN